MAFTTDNLLSDGDIKVILRVDSALAITDKGADDDEYDDYINSGLDESKLPLKPGEEPTRFIMRRSISLKHATRIENAKLKYDGAGGEISVQLGYIIEEVRASLKGIEYHPSVPENKRIVFKFTGDGLVDERQMAALIAAGVVQNLYAARVAALKAMQEPLKKS